jgi:hypothetical protein
VPRVRTHETHRSERSSQLALHAHGLHHDEPWRDARQGRLAWRGDLRLARGYGFAVEMELKSEIPIEAVIIGRVHVQLTLECGANPLNTTNTAAPKHSSLTTEAARGGAPDNLTIIAIAIVATVIADGATR